MPPVIRAAAERVEERRAEESAPRQADGPVVVDRDDLVLQVRGPHPEVEAGRVTLGRRASSWAGCRRRLIRRRKRSARAGGWQEQKPREDQGEAHRRSPCRAGDRLHQNVYPKPNVSGTETPGFRGNRLPFEKMNDRDAEHDVPRSAREDAHPHHVLKRESVRAGLDVVDDLRVIRLGPAGEYDRNQSDSGVRTSVSRSCG